MCTPRRPGKPSLRPTLLLSVMMGIFCNERYVRQTGLGSLLGAAQKSRYVTGSRASFRDIGFVTKPFCLRQAASATNLRDKPPRQAFATSPFRLRRHVDSARNSRDEPRDIRMKQVGATYVCNTGWGRDTVTYPYLEPQPAHKGKPHAAKGSRV